MTDLIGRELHTCGIMFCCGAAVMLVFMAGNVLAARCGKRRRAGRAVYLCGWLCAGYLFSEFLYTASRGVISIHGILAMAAGILLWKKIVCGIINPCDPYRYCNLKRYDRDEGYEEEEKRENQGV